MLNYLLKVKLNEENLDIVIDHLKRIVENQYFERTYSSKKHKNLKANFLGQSVTRHPMIGSKLNKNEVLIHIGFNGDAAMIFFKDDDFEIINDYIKIISYKDDYYEDDKFIPTTSTTILKLANIKNASERKELRNRSKSNKEYSDQYWESVEADWRRELDKDFEEDDFDKKYNY